MLKKTVSVLLAAILLLSVFSVTSFAYSYETAANVAKNISSVSSIRDDMILIQTRLKDSVPYQIRKGTYYESSSDKTGTAVYVVSFKLPRKRQFFYGPMKVELASYMQKAPACAGALRCGCGV